MSLKASFYNHYTLTADHSRTVLFNKFWGSVAVIETETAELLANDAVDALHSDKIAELESGGFLEIDEDATGGQGISVSNVGIDRLSRFNPDSTN